MPVQGVAIMTPKGQLDVPLPRRAASQIKGEHKSASFIGNKENV